MLVTRAYANARPPDDRHAQYAFELLNDPATRSKVEAQGDATALAEAIGLWGKCRGDNRRQAITNLRNKQIAHLGALKSLPPIINDVFDVTRATAKALERLAQGAGVVGLSLDSQLSVYREKADRFWGVTRPIAQAS